MLISGRSICNLMEENEKNSLIREETIGQKYVQDQTGTGQEPTKRK